jgi:hypothetical protein
MTKFEVSEVKKRKVRKNVEFMWRSTESSVVGGPRVKEV